MSKKKLPKVIYVIREGSGDNEYLAVHESEFDAAEKYETRIVGVYSLVRTDVVKLVVDVRRPNKP